jgi:SAM-dependent methyltransferase
MPKTIKSLLKRILQMLPAGVAVGLQALYYKAGYIVKQRKYRGTGVFCPCCCKEFSAFEKAKPGHEQNFHMFVALDVGEICPFCASRPRHRIVCDYLEENKQTLFPATQRALIFAPAYGMAIWFNRNKIKYLGADLSSPFAEAKVDIQALPFGDNEFDFISCDHVLEHVQDYMLALKELYRVIKPEGCVEITVPLLPELPATYEDETITSKEERKQKFGQSDHLRIFGMDFPQKLRDAGFALTIHDGDTCDERIVPITGACVYNYNKAFFCRKPTINTEQPIEEQD